MTKTQFAQLYAEAVGISVNRAKEDLERLGDIMAAELLAGGEITLPRVGKLITKETKPRTARNPKTGDTIHVPAGKKVVLRVGKELKESLN